MSRSSTEAALAETLSAGLPAEFRNLTAEELGDISAHVGAALDHHQTAIDDAEENIVNLVPRPVRGTVRRLLRSGR